MAPLVQIFLPYPDFQQTMACLDTMRLRQQRTDAMKILQGVEPTLGSATPWFNERAAHLWREHARALMLYYDLSLKEYIRRGFRNHLQFCLHEYMHHQDKVPMPFFIGDEAFHRSHQSRLVQLDPEHYRKYFPDVPDNLPLVWPKQNVINLKGETL